MKLDVYWCEQQHFNYFMHVLTKTAADETEERPRKLTVSEIVENMV
jgi:hypothetical protein